ncbi:uncharacterized protein A4U43_C08F22190 [Asparagus officinalis]|uniref:uncharacterized protein LOC109821462 n=1 Tax=Asparagus officinalis TaxID=4686 RepID=UPI00098E258F|nr:uncharacterized protein LOC109821462 [Asparagus officinalis]ONK60753.1 uncharacterized protein A4U43_C08F22190 [Asparagus officinalis]
MPPSLLLFGKKRETTFNPNLPGLKMLANDDLQYPYVTNCVNRNFTASKAKAEDDYNKEEDDGASCWASYGRGHVCKLPPAIPLLARTAKLSCHMPWILKRSYEADGRLVIREVRVKHHEYFRVHRSNGRLLLRLIEVDGNSPLFASSKKCEVKDEEGDLTVRSEEENSCSSSSSPTSTLLYVENEGRKMDETNKVENFESIRAKDYNETEYEADKHLKFLVSLSSMSSSTSEPTLPMGMRKGCFADGRGCSPLNKMMPVSRMGLMHV